MSAPTCQRIVKGKACGGRIDPDEGVCETCGQAPEKGKLMAAVATANVATAATTTKTGSARVSRRQTTSHRTSALGAGLVSLPPVPSHDPMSLVMTSAEVAPGRRACPHCGARVNRMNGFCPQCSEAYDFRPGLKAGDLVAGKYEIKGPMGLGGMGWIYLGFDVVLKRWVVLKGVLNEKDPEAAAAALAERQFLAAVKHPNIVSIYDFAAERGQGYMVLEYVGGRTLDEIRADGDVLDLLSPDDGKRVRSGVLRKDLTAQERALVQQVTRYGVLPPEQAFAYLMALMPAFSYLHASGFTHNDMKPENVMIDGDRVKLIDLGAMRRIGDTGGLIFGTEGFLAPEASQDPVAVSDLYAVGRTLAILLMDFLYKFRADTDAATHKTTTRRLLVTGYKNALPGPDEQPLLRDFDALRRFLLRATHENPDERFQSADEMQSQLFGLLREVMALKEGPKPAESKVFFGDGLIDAADAQGAAQPLARLLPALRLDATDAAAGEVVGLAAQPDPARRLAALQQLAARAPASKEAPLRAADAMIAAGSPEPALALCEKMLTQDPFEWRAHWYAAKALLSQADTPDLARAAQTRFDRVYFEMPGELAPRLGLAMAAERAGDLKAASAFYERIVAIDPGFAAAVFGLARCRRAAQDNKGAAEALAKLPASHSLSVEARLQQARALMASQAPDALMQAGETLAGVGGDTAALHAAAADLFVQAIQRVETGWTAPGGARLIGVALTPVDLRREATRRFQLLARLAATAAEKAYWVDRAHAIRPVTWV